MREEWYTTVEVARLLGRSDRFVRDRVKTGELPAVAKQNEKRASYKISREALMGFLLGSERKSVKEVAAVLKDADEGYLRELEEVILKEIGRRKNSRMEIVPLREENKRLIFELEERNLRAEVLIGLGAEYDRFFNDPMHLCATVIDRFHQRAEGHLSVEITSVEFYEALRRAEVDDNFQPPWQKGQTPILYVDCLILEDPAWAPFLFRALAKQIREVCRREGIKVEGCFAIGSSTEAVRLMERYGFREVGRYKREHPIMLNADVTRGRMGAYLR